MARRGVRAVVLCGAWLLYLACGPVSAQTVPGGQDTGTCGADLVKTLAGAWKAPQYRMKRASDLSNQVFGPDALDIRDVELTLESSGDGVLKIASSVVDQKAKTWAPTLIEANIAVAAPRTALQMAGAVRCDPAVTVASVEQRYLDDTNYHTALTGSRVMMITDPAAKQIEVRFETPKGEGSFWSTLVRQAPLAKRTRTVHE